MGTVIESAVVIGRPVEDVFGFLLDLERSMPLVDPDVESVERAPPGPLGAGTTYQVRRASLAPFAWAGQRVAIRYTAVDPNRRIEFEAKLGPIAPSASFNFEPANGGTRLTF